MILNVTTSFLAVYGYHLCLVAGKKQYARLAQVRTPVKICNSWHVRLLQSERFLNMQAGSVTNHPASSKELNPAMRVSVGVGVCVCVRVFRGSGLGVCC